LEGVAESRAWEPELPALAYELSLRALGQQEASLNELRAHPKVDRLFDFYRTATAALLAEVGFWTLQLALS